MSGVEETKIDQSNEGIVVATSILDTKIDMFVCISKRSDAKQQILCSFTLRRVN